jgi:hypothetical protein
MLTFLGLLAASASYVKSEKVLAFTAGIRAPLDLEVSGSTMAPGAPASEDMYHPLDENLHALSLDCEEDRKNEVRSGATTVPLHF